MPAPATHTADDFLALRADWKAAGCPKDHPYLRLDVTPGPVVGLVSFSDGSSYSGR